MNITKLKDVPTKQSFIEALDEQLNTILLYEQDVEAAWLPLWETVYSTAMECLRPFTRRQRNWFDENHAKIMDLIEKKCTGHLVYLHDPQCTTKKNTLRSIHSTVQLKLCEMQESWLNPRIQGYANVNDMKNFYRSQKKVYSPTGAGSSPFLRADGTNLISENKILGR